MIGPETADMTTVRKAVDQEIDALSQRLFEINDWMYHNPEPGFVEFKASTMLTDELKQHGFEVEMGVPDLPPNFDRLKIIGGLPADYSGPTGLPTAFKARYKGRTEPPVIGIAVEYDALRGNPPFHGCQHNMQGPTGIGAAIALAKVMEARKIPGSVSVIGTPAEEIGPPAKAAQARAGYYDGIDFMLRSHGTSQETLRHPGGFAARHIRQMKYTFHGKSAHAQGAWEGVSALDAVMLLFHAMEMQREHSEPQFRFHGVVTDGGVAPNIVPEMASATMWIRHIIDKTPVGAVSPKKAGEMIDAKVAQLDAAAKGCAMATGTTVDIDHYGDYKPGIGVGVVQGHGCYRTAAGDGQGTARQGQGGVRHVASQVQPVISHSLFRSPWRTRSLAAITAVGTSVGSVPRDLVWSHPGSRCTHPRLAVDLLPVPFSPHPAEADAHVEAAVVLAVTDGHREVEHPVVASDRPERPAATQQHVCSCADEAAHSDCRSTSGEDSRGVDERARRGSDHGPYAGGEVGLDRTGSEIASLGVPPKTQRQGYDLPVAREDPLRGNRHAISSRDHVEGQRRRQIFAEKPRVL